MRTLIVALGLAAMAAGPAWAQGVSRASNNGTAAAAARNAATTSTNATTGTTTADVSLPSTAAATDSPATTPATTTPSSGAQTGFGINNTTDVNSSVPGNSFAPNGPFSNDSGNTALGTSPGQSSSGTLAGNSGQGIGADSTGLGTNRLPGVATIVPEGTVSTIGGTTGGGFAAAPMQQGQQAPQVTIAGASQTPLFDQAAREGRAKEARRRATGNEPRIYGIAPNTERDLTWQMPDDRIIRY